MVRSLMGVALALVLAACASGTTLTYVGYEITGLLDQFRYAGGGRDFKVAILGNPTKAPKADFDAAVVAAMQGGNGGPTTHFTTHPGADAREGYRTVLAFSGAPAPNSRTLCQGRPDIAPVASRLYLIAAFCARDRALVHLMISLPAVDDPTDTRLAGAIGLAVKTLYPAIEPGEVRSTGSDFDP